MNMRVIFVTSHPIQYQVPIFRLLTNKRELELTVLFAMLPDAAAQGAGFGVESGGIGAQVGVQFVGVMVTVIYTGIISFFILKVVDVVIGLRVTEEEETEGLDLVSHDERGYNF